MEKIGRARLRAGRDQYWGLLHLWEGSGAESRGGSEVVSQGSAVLIWIFFGLGPAPTTDPKEKKKTMDTHHVEIETEFVFRKPHP